MTTNVTTRRIRIAAHDGGEFEGYLAVPASGSGPGLVLCQEIFGLNGFVRQTAERLAEEGCGAGAGSVLAPAARHRTDRRPG